MEAKEELAKRLLRWSKDELHFPPKDAHPPLSISKEELKILSRGNMVGTQSLL